MTDFGTFGDVTVTLAGDFVATAELRRPPNNFFDHALIASLCDAFEALDADPRCRAIVLCAEGKHFCAGANFGSRDPGIGGEPGSHLYDEAVRLFRTRTPVVAAIQGAAVGGGLGLALMPDFRVAAPEARFSANFARLGFHHGFGLSVTLPRLVGTQRAAEMLYTGRRLPAQQALEIGLCDRLVDDKGVLTVCDLKFNVNAEEITRSGKNKLYPAMPANKVTKYVAQTSIYAEMLAESGLNVSDKVVAHVWDGEWKHHVSDRIKGVLDKVL